MKMIFRSKRIAVHLGQFQRTAACVALSCTALNAAAASAPRAWLVSKGSAQAVLVAESHLGTPAENDSYFDTVIQPSYAAADTAVMETFWGPEQKGNEAVDRGTPCATDPKDRRTNRVRPAFNELISATRANGLEVPNWMEHRQILPEFLHTSLFLDQFMGSEFGRAYTTAIETQLGLGTSLRLRASGRGPAEKNLRGLEPLKVQRTIFCSASAAHSQDYLADRVLQVAALLRLKQSHPNFGGLNQFAAAMNRSFEEHVRCIDRPVSCTVEKIAVDTQLLRDAGWTRAFSPGTFEILITQRTHAWIPLIENAMLAPEKTFIIVGTLHLPDLSIGGKVAPGLISQLRERGYSVTPIGSADDLKSTFLAPSISDRIRSWFSQR